MYCPGLWPYGGFSPLMWMPVHRTSLSPRIRCPCTSVVNQYLHLRVKDFARLPERMFAIPACDSDEYSFIVIYARKLCGWHRRMKRVAMQNTFGVHRVEEQGGIVCEGTICRDKRTCDLPLFLQSGQLLQHQAFGKREGAAAGAGESGEVCTATEELAQVVGQGANVGAFATFDGQFQARRLPVQQV